ncbi:PilZ domain-containing protein [Rhizobium sp. SL86]|uniref:PilZ domain-containing protein n=1 Tax=Rhizobium sp. SL86 TaxID=2995148 RepID=UPI002276AE1E|nr:PilZ domain-containing protein [Rhizobium sp. SL86]MCY1664380.1 PilZ domain-containing protein [Rhizobium sp. SL86]
MSGKLSLKFLPLSLLAVLAGCNSSSPIAGLNVGQPAAQQQPVTPVVQAYCPDVVMRDDTAIRSTYAGNAKDDPEKLIYRASLADATRACTANETTLTITVMAQGRIVLGPAGKPGPTKVPVVVEVVEGDNVIYSQTTQFNVDIPPEGSTQFIFAKNDVAIPNTAGGVSRFTRVRLGFEAVAAKKTTRRPG